MIVLKSIEEEAADCRARCKDMRIGDMVLHCHHDILCERLTEPIENRIAYILAEKTDNVALRLRMLRPAITDGETQADAKWKDACAEWDAACAEWDAACAEWDAACAEWDAACAEWDVACALWDAACAEWDAACAEWDAACAEWDAAYAKLKAICAEWDAACAERDAAYERHYARLFPDSPWNGKTIFAGEFTLTENEEKV